MSIALFKRRVYRFDENPLSHVLAECLENKTLRGEQLHPFTINTINHFLRDIKSGRKEIINYNQLADCENIHLDHELMQREDYEQGLSDSPEALILELRFSLTLWLITEVLIK